VGGEPLHGVPLGEGHLLEDAVHLEDGVDGRLRRARQIAHDVDHGLEVLVVDVALGRRLPHIGNLADGNEGA